MNRIIAINLCSIVFQIDEIAYDSLKKYLSEIKNHLGNSASSTEVYQDVENRIAELFQHKINSGAQAILPKDVKIDTFYDRTNLMDFAQETVIHNLLEGIILVTIIVMLFILL